MTKSRDALEDLIRGLRPDERLRLFVADRDKPRDRRFEFASTAMHAAANLLLRQRGEPAFHEVDPRGAGGREVQVKPRMPRQPPTNARGFVGAVVVQDEMDI